MRRPDSNLAALGRELNRLQRRCRQLREVDWTSWSSAIEQANALARRVGRMRPRSIDELVARYEALAWLLLEQDDVIVDDEGRRAFVAFGRALKRMASRPD